jgi:hypothetical protein
LVGAWLWWAHLVSGAAEQIKGPQVGATAVLFEARPFFFLFCFRSSVFYQSCSLVKLS